MKRKTIMMLAGAATLALCTVGGNNFASAAETVAEREAAHGAIELRALLERLPVHVRYRIRKIATARRRREEEIALELLEDAV